MKKTQDVRQIVIDAWAGTRNNPIFKTKSDEFFIGYATAMTNLQNLHLSCSIKEIEDTIRLLLKEREI